MITIISLGKIENMMKEPELFAEVTPTFILRTGKGHNIRFTCQETLSSLAWLIGKEVKRQFSADGDHVLVNGVCLATVKETTADVIWYPSAANNTKRRLAEAEQNV